MNGADRKLIDEVRIELSGKIDELRENVFSAINGLKGELKTFQLNELTHRVTKEECNVRHSKITSSNIIYAVLIFFLGGAVTTILFLINLLGK